MIANTPECFARHMGLVMCENSAIQLNFTLMKNGLMPMKSAAQFEQDKQRVDRGDYQIEDGIATIKICGLMQKPESKYDGFCSTVKTRASIRAADCDPLAKGIALIFDTPGGFTAGTAELADTIAGIEKPCRGYVMDNCHSAGMWAASQCDKLSINQAGRCGSIGTYGVIYDTSKAAEMDGVKAILISSGGIKGQGVDGVPVSEECIAAYQSQVDSITAMFTAAVSAGRKMPLDKVQSIATGATWSSADALSLGLVDAVESFDSFMQNFIDELDDEENKTLTGAFKMSKDTQEPKIENVAPVAAAPAVAEPAAEKVETVTQDALPEFQAMADIYGYDFAKANFGKSETEILAVVIVEKDVRIQALESENAELKAAQPKPAVGMPAVPVAMSAPKVKAPMYDDNGKLIKK